ncbi:alpha-L-fucosidase [Porcincola intestinalis]|uniref:alpha-L-fucosidase n=1 Tax=Porcincola intestinalis TaxID=2606632 RepID=UPI0023F3D341|nr:alpha-L-fucosidase [Porcincola intestinalis]MCI6767704.1 alpha-L-fucosidase [Lachnospiraceae bacterium]MDD7060434.1 alpha-L-fucosidase [Porcincola intestinalis]MDY5282454.1 alpha-L-fucosidase [Porcincola intestinalis]
MYQFDRAAYEKRMKWFTEARFGMFIHYGLYSIPARGEWVMSDEEMTDDEYRKYFDAFDPCDLDMRQWAKAAKDAGMKYMVMTAKHHDGFCLYDSKYTDFKSTNTACHRDLVREYVEAVREQGLKVGLYFSLIDWRHPDFPHYKDRQHPMRNHPECGNEGRDFDRYLKYMHAQVRELMENYGKIDLLWLDFSYDDLRGEAWKATELVSMIRSLQPDIILNNRLEVSGEGFGSLAEGHPTPYHGDFITPEQMIPPAGLKDPAGNSLVWEACVTMNGHWGYCAQDHFFKPSSMLVRKLVECVSKGGNMILNVGPDAKGNFPKESVRILHEIGSFMRENGDSIYGCGACAAKPEGMYRLTRKGSRIYVHIFENTIGPFPIPGIPKDKVKGVRLLRDGSGVKISTSWVHSDYPDILFADLGPDPVLPDQTDTVLALELEA